LYPRSAGWTWCVLLAIGHLLFRHRHYQRAS
jgi:hypothetical protein